ncbi:hypothetical protein NQ315_007365, partial [Exocentrus adspersus]
MVFSFGCFLMDLLGLVTTVTAMIYAYYVWSFQYWKTMNVPHLEPVIPWGNFENPGNRTKSIGDLLRDIYQQAKAKGWKHCGIYTMARPGYIIMNLNTAKLIMAKDFHNFVDRGIYTNEKDDPLSCHLFAISGTKWRNLRMKLSPTFTSGRMKSMFNTLVDCSTILTKYVEDHVGDRDGVDIKDVLGNFSTDVIGSCAFGLECNSFKDPDSLFREYGKKVVNRTKLENLTAAFAMNFPRLAGCLRLRLVSKPVSDFFIKIVEDTVAYREDNNIRRNDFLQLLIDIRNKNLPGEDGHKGDGKTLSMNEIAAQSFVFFFAGFETSSTTMTFALFEMATHQDIQDKVREEIRIVLAKHDDKITYDAINELQYMKQVIDETLRMYSPVPFVTRVPEEDYTIPGENIVIEKGIRVFIPIHAIHYDEEYYETPKVFDPQRFSEANKAERHPYAHLPFGEGPRICI